MTKNLRHKFNQAIADGTDATLVRPSNWNDDHNLWLGMRSVSVTTDAIADGDHLTLVRYKNAGATAVSLPAPTGSTMIAGWSTTLQNVTAVPAVTVTGTGCTVNGASTLVLAPGDAAQIFSDGTSDYAAIVNRAAGAAAGLTLLQSLDASGLGRATLPMDVTYDEYEVHLLNVGVASGPSNLLAQFSQDGGSSWLTSSNYFFAGVNGNMAGPGAASIWAGQSQSSLLFWPASSIPTSSFPTRSVFGKFTIFNPSNTTIMKSLGWSLGGWSDDGYMTTISGYGGNAVTGAINAIGFTGASSFRSGSTFKLYGVKK